MTASVTDQVPELSLKQLRELRKSDELLYVRNNTPHLITCNRDKDHPFHIDPAGTNGSIQILPKEILDMPGFQRLWMLKKVTVSDDERMETQIQLLMGGQLKLTQERMDQIMGLVDAPAASRALQEARCLVCDGRVFLSETALKNGEKPLCDLHVGEAPQFVAELQEDGTYAFGRVNIG